MMAAAKVNFKLQLNYCQDISHISQHTEEYFPTSQAALRGIVED